MSIFSCGIGCIVYVVDVLERLVLENCNVDTLSELGSNHHQQSHQNLCGAFWVRIQVKFSLTQDERKGYYIIEQCHEESVPLRKFQAVYNFTPGDAI